MRAAAETIVTFFWAAWSSATTRSWQSIGPGRLGVLGQATTQITGIR
jgi:hypothetical protein